MADASQSETSERTHERIGGAAFEDFIGTVPGAVLRWGNTVLFAVFLALVVAAWLLEYPDVVAAPVTVTSQTPPAPVVARTSGRLAQLWVEDGELVQRGQWLAVIDNPARSEDLRVVAELLEALADQLEAPERFDAAAHSLGAPLELGELDVEYAELVSAWLELRAFVDDPYFDDSDAGLLDQLDTSDALAGRIRRQRGALVEDLEQARREAKAATRLAEEGVVASREVEAAEATVRARERALEAADVEILRSKIDQVGFGRNRAELGFHLRDRRRALVREVHDSYANLARAYERWRRAYLLVAPTAGRVSLARIWATQQWVSADEAVINVLPEAETLVGRATMPQLNSGKVAVGQRVLLKLDGYPYREHGVVEGRVGSVSAVASEGVYLVNVELPDGLRTTHGQTLELRHGMGGTAEIVTADRRLLERMFIQLYGLVRSD
ncbi:HlyD family efflux transporter periplasmic adaptor subunit [Enhygromyxa salina]|uniref:Hemolysin secretion protein D, chromosomal n=1 Tax=Enhygromyxa salina TaxID=215803 RepID=A0A2S9XQ51_9BACT|nr:HlyD family efflux transporter periplasmic adaptor subunit [Enhygromyxa salina]PRP94821.1 Hemolysin secretion protein D, chromosomal [Enhygromyxa salina]